MNGEALTSIVIPAYNAERFVGEGIESALGQRGAVVEVVVVDDGSRDGTLDVIRRFARDVRFATGPNRGASSARNTGTALARGEFLQYLDADDLLAPDAVAARLDAIRTNGADVAYSDWQKLEEREDGSFAPGETVARTMEDVDSDPEIATFTSFWAPPAALLYSRGIVERIGAWREDLPIIQDARFLQDAAMHGAKFVHVPSTSATYRVHRAESLSRRNASAFAADVYHNATDIQSIWERRGALTEAQRRALASAYDFTCRALLADDPSAFDESLQRFRAVGSGIRPLWPRIAGTLARALGHRSAAALLRSVGKLETESGGDRMTMTGARRDDTR